MHARFSFRNGVPSVLFAGLLATAMAASVAAQPSFISFDPRLPNPDQPYVLEGNAAYGNATLSSLEIRITNPSQLDIPSLNLDGYYEFDSMFDVQFSAVLGIGLAPPRSVSGVGTAHVTGITPAGTEPLFAFDTELVEMNLAHVSPIFEVFMLRESLTQSSTGVTRVDGACYTVCPADGNGPAVVLPLQISSFFDVFTEISLDGGATWIPSDNPLVRIVQTPEPTTFGLAIGATCVWLVGKRHHRRRSRTTAQGRTILP